MRAMFFYVETQKLDRISFGEASSVKKIKGHYTIARSLVAGIR